MLAAPSFPNLIQPMTSSSRTLNDLDYKVEHSILHEHPCKKDKPIRWLYKNVQK